MKRSKSYKKFLKCHDRAVAMVRRHYNLWNDSEEEWDESHDDLFRAGIVLVVSAMDAYYTDRFCEALIPYIKKNGLNDSLEKLVVNAGLNTEKAIEMFENKRPKRVLSNMVRRHLETVVTQNFKKIDKLYLCLGYEKPITFQAQEFSRRKRLIKAVEKLVERRHKIVHAGDYNKHGRLNPINYYRMLKKFIELRKLVQSTDAVLENDKI